jgi:hypothetical protein
VATQNLDGLGVVDVPTEPPIYSAVRKFSECPLNASTHFRPAHLSIRTGGVKVVMATPTYSASGHNISVASPVGEKGLQVRGIAPAVLRHCCEHSYQRVLWESMSRPTSIHLGVLGSVRRPTTANGLWDHLGARFVGLRDIVLGLRGWKHRM